MPNAIKIVMWHILCALFPAVKKEGGFKVRFPSHFDNSSLVMVVVFSSENVKTGDMCQITFLREDMDPVQALRSGQDHSVCGTCKYRSGSGCYVEVAKSVRSMYLKLSESFYMSGENLKKGSGYIEVPSFGMAGAILAILNKPVRFGAYGDPASVSPELWNEFWQGANLFGGIEAWTGYTHAWQVRQDLRSWLMASVDSTLETIQAHANGWRTFRVYADSAAFLEDRQTGIKQVECLSDAKGLTCASCLICDGNDRAGTERPAMASVYIYAHGGKVTKARMTIAEVHA